MKRRRWSTASSWPSTGYCVVLLRLATKDNRDHMIQTVTDWILKPI